MRVPEFMIDAIERARADAFRAARAVPEERLDWKPLNLGQSAMGMCRELAKTPDWAFYILSDAQPEEPENAAAQAAEMASWTTVDACEAACVEKLARLYDLYRGLSDVDLARTRWLPFNGGREHTYAELLQYPRWNFTYHQGQIEYIVSLVGPRSEGQYDRHLAKTFLMADNNRQSST